MQIRIREDDRNEGQSLQDYRAAQARAFIQRNQAKFRAEFWERKRRDHEAGERWLAANAPEELAR